MQWTTEQEQVIRHKKGNLLVAAAAGSGKTAVLVQHVIERIMDPEDPVKLSEMVIMTFTEAAAQEMRDRIRTALEEKLREHPDHADLIREAGSIQNANISTIDAFCKRFITENYAAIDLDPGFRMGDQGELKLLQGDILEELLEEEYAAGDADFLRFADTFGRGKTDDGAAALVLKLYTDASAHPWPEEYLEACLQTQDADGEQLLFRQLQARVTDDRKRMAYALSVCEEPDGPESYIPNLSSETEALRRAETSENLKELIERVKAVRFDRVKPTKSPLKGRVTDIRNAVKKDMQALAGMCPACSPELTEQMEQGIQSCMRGLVRLTKRFIRQYQAEKERRHMLDFSDLEHKALDILYTIDEEGHRKPSQIADDCARQYREILVDEYQDSNFVQEALIFALSAERFGRPDVFQVGDVKQSIYSFRQARPALFLTKYQDEAYPKIELSKNFRSRNEVIRAVNRVFRRVMRPALGGIDYNERAALHYGYPKAEEREEIDPKYQCELLLLAAAGDDGKASSEEALSKPEGEAHMIASRIRKLHEEGRSYRDIVILLRSPGAWADTLVEILGVDGIPAYCTSNEGYFNTVEVETVLALLHVIDNPRQDIALAAVLHSPMYDFSDEELAELTIAFGSLQEAVQRMLAGEAAGAAEEGGAAASDHAPDTPPEASASGNASEEQPSDFRTPALAPELKEKLQNFASELQHYRSMACYLPIHELLYRIYDETGYYNYASAMPAGKRRKANLDALIDMALSFEKTSYKGLFDYIRYIEKLKKYNSDQGEAAVYSDQDDLVRVMSIHKSKGLQFPVVFLSGMGRKFNKRSLSDAVLVDAELGIGCDYVDLENKVKIPSVKRTAIRGKQEAEQLGEELRVLYVAMTRAEEKLILTAVVDDTEKLLSKYPDAEIPLSGTELRGAGCYLDWILMTEGADNLMRTGSVISLSEYTPADLLRSETQHTLQRLEARQALQAAMEAVDTDTEDYRALQHTLSYCYPYEAATHMYPKHSVSELKEIDAERAAAGQMHASPASEEANASSGNDVPASENEGIRRDMPAALMPVQPEQEKGGTAAGDAYHHALECYDYTDSPENFMEQLRSKLPEAELRFIRPRRFRAFLESPLAERFRRAQAAGQLYREQHFMKQVPHSYLFPDSDSTEPVILQGIMDAFFIEDGGIVLVDYKSDHVRKEETLIRRYRKQLELYADALEKITGLPVKEKLIYAITLEKCIAL